MDKNKLIEEALDNIRTDRVTTESLLQKLQQEIQQNQIENTKAGFVAAKYVETLQRSNEQLVKVSGLIQKQQSGKTGLSEDDKHDIFDLLQEEI